jgi:ribosomal protein S18 acetylase RimI-like enzyme
MPVIRDATPDDAYGLALSHVRTWRAAYAHVIPIERLDAVDVDARAEQRRAWLSGEGIDPRIRTIVADLDGEIVGHSTFGPRRDGPDTLDDAEIYSIYVSPEHWSTGTGRALMDEALARLRASGVRTVRLWVLDDNPRARRFYERAGFATDGEAKTDDFLGVAVAEVRYARTL